MKGGENSPMEGKWFGWAGEVVGNGGAGRKK